MRRTPAVYAPRSRELVQSRGAGPRQRPDAGTGTGAGRTSPNRAHTSPPSKSAVTAHQPEESRAAGSLVTSRRSRARRPPNRAIGESWDTLASLWPGAPRTASGETNPAASWANGI